MKPGKLASQVSHASIAFLTKRCVMVDERFKTGQFYTSQCNAILDWLNNSFKKIVVGVDTEEELVDLYEKSLEVVQLHNLSHLITDSGDTVFKQPTKTCLALGPYYDEILDPLTRKLKLL